MVRFSPAASVKPHACLPGRTRAPLPSRRHRAVSSTLRGLSLKFSTTRSKDGWPALGKTFLNWTSGNSENDVTPVNTVSNQGGTTNAFPGLMDDFRIYNHALSASEIGALVPEPSSVALLGLGLSILATRYRRRRSK